MTLRWRGLDGINVLVLVLVVGLSWLPRFGGPIDLRYDAGVYLLTGLSLANGTGYKLTHEPGDPQAVQYPPGLPALIAVVSALTDDSQPATVGQKMRVLYFVFQVLLVVLTYMLSRQHLGPFFSLGAGLLFATSPLLLFYSDLMQAELPFALVTTAYMLVVGYKGYVKRNWLEGPIALLGSFAVSIRVAGIAFLLARAFACLVRRDWLGLVTTAMVFVAAMGVWQIYVHTVKSSESYRKPAYEYQRADYMFYNVDYSDNISYVDPFRPELGKAGFAEYMDRVRNNLEAFVVSASAGFMSTPKTVAAGLKYRLSQGDFISSAASIAATLLGLSAIVGLFLLLRRGEILIPSSVLLSFLLVATTPWPGQIERYLLPVGGLLAISLMVVARSLCELGNASLRKVSRSIVTVVFLGFPLFFNAVGVLFFFNFYRPAEAPELYPPKARMFSFETSWRGFNQAHSWVAAEARPDEVIASSTPTWSYLLTGRKSVMPPFENDADREQYLLDGVPVSYLIIDDFRFIDVSKVYAAKAVAAHPGLWTKVFVSEDGGVSVYKRQR